MSEVSAKPVLPIAEADFDALVFGLAAALEDDGIEAAVARLSDDDLLTFAVATEHLQKSGMAAQNALDATRIWMEIYAAVVAEMETR